MVSGAYQFSLFKNTALVIGLVQRCVLSNVTEPIYKNCNKYLTISYACSFHTDFFIGFLHADCSEISRIHFAFISCKDFPIFTFGSSNVPL